MQRTRKALLFGVVLSAGAAYAAQAPTQAPAPASPPTSAPAKPATAAQAAPTAPSALLKPSLDQLLQTLGGLKLDKWKGGSVRTEAAANIASIQQDLQSTLPGLLATADAAPGTVSKVLPAFRNVDAVYDVVLRVFVAAKVSAPADQIAQLQQAMGDLDKSRRALGDRVQEMSVAQEKQVVDLQASLKTLPAPVCPVTPPAPAPAPTPAKKPVAKKKKPATTTPKPAASQPSETTPPPATKPQN